MLNWVSKWTSTVRDGQCAAETGWVVDQIGRARSLEPLDLFQAQRAARGLGAGNPFTVTAAGAGGAPAAAGRR